MTYTELCGAALAVTVLLDLVLLRTRVLARRAFWVAYAIIVAFQLVTNGWLTGRRIVSYAGQAILGGAHPVLLGQWRVGYAPVEDLLFGFALVAQTLSWWVFWGRRGVQPPAARGAGRSATGTPRGG